MVKLSQLDYGYEVVIRTGEYSGESGIVVGCQLTPEKMAELVLGEPYEIPNNKSRRDFVRIPISDLEILAANDPHGISDQAKARGDYVNYFEGARNFERIGSPSRETEMQ